LLYFDGLVIEKKRRKITTRLFYKMLDVYYIRRSRKINENTNKYRMGVMTLSTIWIKWVKMLSIER
jgi:hypothetical protein